MEVVVVAALVAGEVPAAARVLARAMDGDDGYRHLFPGPDREEGLADLFTANLGLHVGFACSWTWSERGEVVGTVTLRPATGIRVGPVAMVRHGLVGFAWRRGWGVTQRLLWLKRAYERLEAELTSGPHFLVHMMGVAPERQGAGIGGRLLGEVLAATADRAPGVPTLLTTHSERNVTFYRRAGFEVAARRAVTPPVGAPWTVWAMRRG